MTIFQNCGVNFKIPLQYVDSVFTTFYSALLIFTWQGSTDTHHLLSQQLTIVGDHD